MARGGRGARGGIIGRGGLRVPFKPKTYVPRHPFDMALCEPVFPRIKPLPSEDAFTQVILCYSKF